MKDKFARTLGLIALVLALTSCLFSIGQFRSEPGDDIEELVDARLKLREKEKVDRVDPILNDIRKELGLEKVEMPLADLIEWVRRMSTPKNPM